VLRRAVVLLTVLVALAVAPGTLAQQAAPQASLPDIEDEVMCPVCGVTLELATESPQANQERDFIRKLIAQGLTKDEIKDRLVAEFGSEVLAEPGDSGFDLAAWLVPGAAILLAAAAIVVGLRRWRRAGAAEEVAEADEPEPDADDSERLDADLARYRL
jgi:cytochrome c-type biogenesis protein CcmH